MRTHCVLHPDKECDGCEASTMVEGLDGGIAIGPIQTQCKVIAALWNIGESLSALANALNGESLGDLADALLRLQGS